MDRGLKYFIVWKSNYKISLFLASMSCDISWEDLKILCLSEVFILHRMGKPSLPPTSHVIQSVFKILSLLAILHTHIYIYIKWSVFWFLWSALLLFFDSAHLFSLPSERKPDCQPKSYVLRRQCSQQMSKAIYSKIYQYGRFPIHLKRNRTVPVHRFPHL